MKSYGMSTKKILKKIFPFSMQRFRYVIGRKMCFLFLGRKRLRGSGSRWNQPTMSFNMLVARPPSSHQRTFPYNPTDKRLHTRDLAENRSGRGHRQSLLVKTDHWKKIPAAPEMVIRHPRSFSAPSFLRLFKRYTHAFHQNKTFYQQQSDKGHS